MAKIKYPKKLPAQHQQKPGIEEKCTPNQNIAEEKKWEVNSSEKLPWLQVAIVE